MNERTNKRTNKRTYRRTNKITDEWPHKKRCNQGKNKPSDLAGWSLRWCADEWETWRRKCHCETERNCWRWARLRSHNDEHVVTMHHHSSTRRTKAIYWQTLPHSPPTYEFWNRPPGGQPALDLNAFPNGRPSTYVSCRRGLGAITVPQAHNCERTNVIDRPRGRGNFPRDFHNIDQSHLPKQLSVIAIDNTHTSFPMTTVSVVW